MTTFTESSWSQNAELIEAIRDHPFNRELSTGELDPARFAHYVVQDSLYLRRYGQVLALCAAKADRSDDLQFFTGSASVAIEVEQSMHAGFMSELGVSEAELAGAKATPTCQGYTDFLLATAYAESYPVAVAATLPCFWVYWDVGNHIARGASSPNRYQAWIDTYSDEGFGSSVDQIKAIADRCAEASGPAVVEAMHEAFRLSTLYEWMFWDSAHRLADWPSV